MSECEAPIRIELVPLDKVLPHEHVEARRVAKLKVEILGDGVLKDPPIATRYQEHLIILDGATRTRVLRELRASHIPLQVVGYHKPDVRLQTWNHALHGIPASEILQRVQRASNTTAHPMDSGTLYRGLDGNRLSFGLLLEDGTAMGFDWIEDLHDRVVQLNRIAKAFQDVTEIVRSPERDMVSITHHYPGLSAMILYPVFQPADVIQCVLDHVLLPAGITRHIVMSRLMGIDLPLELLMDPGARNGRKNRSPELGAYDFITNSQLESDPARKLSADPGAG